jgi:hypothetical protein
MSGRTVYTSFSESDMSGFAPSMKIGLLATLSDERDEGLPHVTLLSTLQASSPTQMVWGQFTEGLSKQFIKRDPRTAFLIMTLDKELWRGKATFTHTARRGKEYDMYNDTPMFRYNAYFGVHTVYYMDLLEHYGRQALPMGRIVMAAMQTMAAKALSRKREHRDVLNPWTQALMNKIDNLKFLAYVGEDGYPTIIPVIQAQAFDGERIIFSLSAYRDDLEAVPAGATVAVFGMSLDMEDVLMRGVFRTVRRMGGVRCGVVEVNWVYNSMPPKPQQVYPEIAVEPVTSFR